MVVPTPHSGVLRTAAFAVIAVILVAILEFGEPVIFPVVLSILTTYALEPIVRALTRIRIPRVLAAATHSYTLWPRRLYRV